MSKTAAYDLRPMGIMPAGAAIQPGQVALANEDVFADTFFSQPLTDYAVGWGDQQRWIRDLLDFIAPPVRTTRRFEYRVANNAKAFAAAENDKDIRALYGEFALVEAIGTIQNGRTLSKGLTTIIDKDDEKENPQLVNQKVAWLMEMLLRAEVIRAAALLNASATNKAVTWGGQNGTNPDIDLNEMVLAGGNASGMDPNRVLIGGQAWQIRLNALASVNTAGGFQGYGMTPEQLADWLGIDRVEVSRLRYQGTSGKAPLVPANTVLAFNASQGAMPEDTSNIKRFWSPEFGGDEWAVWVQDKSSHLKWITVSHKSNIILTSSLGVQKLTVTNGLA